MLPYGNAVHIQIEQISVFFSTTLHLQTSHLFYVLE